MKKPRDETKAENKIKKEIKLEFVDRFKINRACWCVHVKPRLTYSIR